MAGEGWTLVSGDPLELLEAREEAIDARAVGVVGAVVMGLFGTSTVLVGRVSSIFIEGERGDMELMCAATARVSLAEAEAEAEAEAGFGTLTPMVAAAAAVVVRRHTEGKARRATSGDM